MTFAERMLEMLTSAYNRMDIYNLQRGKPPETYIGKLFYLCGMGFDLIKDTAEKVKLWDDIDKMCGTTLDRYGANFGVARGGSNDPIYRVMIKTKIISMLAGGNLDSVISAAAALFNVPIAAVKADELYPAKIYIYVDENQVDQEHKEIADIIAKLMKRLKAAGVGIRIFYKTYHTSKIGLFMALPRLDYVKITVQPEKLNSFIAREIDVNTGVAALNYVKTIYNPIAETGE